MIEARIMNPWHVCQRLMDEDNGEEWREERKIKR